MALLGVLPFFQVAPEELDCFAGNVENFFRCGVFGGVAAALLAAPAKKKSKD